MALGKHSGERADRRTVWAVLEVRFELTEVHISEPVPNQFTDRVIHVL